MDREIAPEIRKRRLTRRTVIILIAAAATLFSLAATLRWIRPSVRRNDILIDGVTRGAVDETIQANGTVVPNVEQVISSPVEARVLRISRRAGDRVQPGDEILALDTSSSRLDLERLDERIAAKRSEALQLRLKVDESIAAAQAALEQKKLDAQLAQLKAQQNQRLRKEGLVAEQDQLLTDTVVRKSDIELAQLASALTRAKRTGDAQLAASAAELSMLEKERAQSQSQLQLAMMQADRAGVLTSVITDAGTTLHRGDVVARIADLSSFRVIGTISDVHVAKLVRGMPVRVRLGEDAAIAGTIASVDPRIENGVARFEVALDTPAHPRLRNNLRVDISVVTGRREGVLRLRRGSLTGAQSEEVFVVDGDRAVRRMAQFGAIGEESIEVTAGLREGEQVIVSNMVNYENADEIRIRK